MSKFCLAKQIVIPAGVKLDWHDATNGDVPVTITAGTYDDIWAFAEQVEDDINDDVAIGTATVEVLTASGSEGKIRVGFTEAFDLEWASGANAGSTVGIYLGFLETEDDESIGGYITSDYQAPGLWVSAWAPGMARRGMREQPEHQCGDEFISYDGTHSVQLYGETRHRRYIEAIMQPAHKVYQDVESTYVNQSFERFIQAVLDDTERYVRYRADVTTPATYTACAIVGMLDWAKDIALHGKRGIERYSWTLELLTQET